MTTDILHELLRYCCCSTGSLLGHMQRSMLVCQRIFHFAKIHFQLIRLQMERHPIYTVSQKKLSRFVFVKFVAFLQISIIFGRKIGNDPNICEVHSFSTSPNLHPPPYRVKRKCSKLLHNAECRYLQ